MFICIMSDIIRREYCAICCSGMKNIYELKNMPLKLCCIDSPEHNNSVVSFAICDMCNTIQLDKLIPLEILYSSSHNTVSVGKTWVGYFQTFCEHVGGFVQQRNVLEIGDPSGKIAMSLDGYNNWFIVEPNKNPNVVFKENIHFIERFFDDTFTCETKIDIIVHSHVFEHIYSPNAFLKKCWEILSDEGEMFFGVPNMVYIAQEGIAPCLGVFFEHTIFLNKENICYMLEKNGFELLSITDYENHSVLYHVKKTMIPEKINIVKIQNYKEIFLESIMKWQEFCMSVDKSYDIFLFGASYNTQYLLTLGLDKYNIVGILDNCKEKQGKYLYGYSIQIFSPNIIKDRSNCIVIIKNGYYTYQIKDQLKTINDKLLIIS